MKTVLPLRLQAGDRQAQMPVERTVGEDPELVPDVAQHPYRVQIVAQRRPLAARQASEPSDQGGEHREPDIAVGAEAGEAVGGIVESQRRATCRSSSQATGTSAR